MYFWLLPPDNCSVLCFLWAEDPFHDRPFWIISLEPTHWEWTQERCLSIKDDIGSSEKLDDDKKKTKDLASLTQRKLMSSWRLQEINTTQMQWLLQQLFQGSRCCRIDQSWRIGSTNAGPSLTRIGTNARRGYNMNKSSKLCVYYGCARYKQTGCFGYCLTHKSNADPAMYASKLEERQISFLLKRVTYYLHTNKHMQVAGMHKVYSNWHAKNAHVEELVCKIQSIQLLWNLQTSLGSTRVLYGTIPKKQWGHSAGGWWNRWYGSNQCGN